MSSEHGGHRPAPRPGSSPGADEGHAGHDPAPANVTSGADTGSHEPREEPAAEAASPKQSMHGGHAGMTSRPSGDRMTTPGGEMDEMVMEPEQGTLWAHFFAIIFLGIWLITSPFALNYGDTGLLWSDIVSGVVLIALATVTITRRAVWSSWAIALVGVYLLFAPLLFWAPTAGAYANDTLVGALAIIFAILMPGMPGLMHMFAGLDRPPGWSYNPSTWPQRAPIIALALLGFILSRQMAAYQLGHTGSVWEPFFDPGTRAVLDSDVSKMFPISDGGFGAVAYAVEALMGFMGDRQRWRSMPWMVTFFGILVVPLGMVSITLIILQPVAVGEWCTPCLIAALAMLIMIALTLDEVVAMGIFLLRAAREGQSVWRVFWLGGTLTEAPMESGGHPDVISAKAMIWGVALPWNLLVAAALGLWLMAAPSIVDSAGNAAHSDHLVGALVVSFAIMAWADVGRALRFVNVLFGAWIALAPWLLDGATTGAVVSDLVVGIALILLSLPRGPVGERYGTWDRYIR